MKDIEIRFIARVKLKKHKLHDGLRCICGDNAKDMLEVEELIKEIDERIVREGKYRYLHDAMCDYYSDCEHLKYFEIYNEMTENKEDKYLINFYLYDLDRKCRVVENEFWITMQQAKEEDRRLL